MLYYGKYRAIVVDTKDPECRGRVRVQCPAVYGDAKSPWCQPCVPFAQDNSGDFMLPKTNEFIWVEFEGGDVQYPIYTGGLWSKDKSPVKDYTTSGAVRHIEFLGGKVEMDKYKISITKGTSSIVISANSIVLKSDAIKLN